MKVSKTNGSPIISIHCFDEGWIDSEEMYVIGDYVAITLTNKFNQDMLDILTCSGNGYTCYDSINDVTEKTWMLFIKIGSNSIEIDKVICMSFYIPWEEDQLEWLCSVIDTADAQEQFSNMYFVDLTPTEKLQLTRQLMMVRE